MSANPELQTLTGEAKNADVLRRHWLSHTHYSYTQSILG